MLRRFIGGFESEPRKCFSVFFKRREFFSLLFVQLSAGDEIACKKVFLFAAFVRDVYGFQKSFLFLLPHFQAFFCLFSFLVVIFPGMGV